MHVLLVHNRYRSGQPSGEDVAVDRDAELLRSAGHRVSLLIRRSDSIRSFSLAEKLAVPFAVTWSRGASKSMARAIDEFEPDVVHVHNTFPLLSVSVVAEAHARGVPVVASIHNFRLICAAGTLSRDGRVCRDCVGRCSGPALVHRCYRGSVSATLPLAVAIDVHRMAKTWERNTSAFVVMSRLSREVLESAGFPENRIHIRPHSVPENGKRRCGPGEGGIFVGRLSEEKGVDLLIDAWLPELGRLTIVGDGPLRPVLEERARGRSLDVVFSGQLQEAAVRDEMRRARFLVLPSRSYETFGLVAVEALSVGVPVVVAAGSAPSEFIEDGRNGAHFRNGDVQSLSVALRRLGDPRAASSMGDAARSTYEHRFTPKVGLATLTQIYDRVLAP